MNFRYKLYIFIILCFFSSVSADDGIEKLGREFQGLMVSQSAAPAISQNLAQNPARFILNVIAYVPAPNDFSYDSPDEEDDGSFSPDLFAFDATDEKTFPFRTITVKKKKKNNEQDIFVVKREMGTLQANDLQETSHKSLYPSQIVSPFLKKLEAGAFEAQDKQAFFSTVRVVIGLNRPTSLSARKNSALKQELDASSCDLPNYCHRFAFFWIPQWFDCNNKAVEYNRVKKFYKQLKRKNPHSATKFREINEKHPLIPYQGLRERVKNHNATKTFAHQLRILSPQSFIYLSIVDSDTVDFNGVYSAYLRLVRNHSTFGQNLVRPITAMTTGYLFQGSGDDGDYPFKIASELDRNIRIAIAQHIPLGVYYPEPNLCVLIPTGHVTVPETFIDKTVTIHGTCESPALLKKVKDRADAVFVFSGDCPLITTIPPRARLTKASKTPIAFSLEFIQGASPTEKDITSLKQISQSHFHEDVLSTNLYINRAFTMTDSSFYHFKGLLSELRKAPTPENYTAIQGVVGGPTAQSIHGAFQDVNKVISDFTTAHKRTLNEQEILDYLKKNQIDIDSVDHEKIQIFSDKDIKKLIIEGDEILDINDLTDVPTQTLRDILYAESVCEWLEEQWVSFNDLLKLYEPCPGDFSDFFETFREFQYESGEDIDEFIRLYTENPLHIECMAGDPLDMALELAPEVDDVILSYLEPEDIAWVREQLSESEQMIFNSNLGVDHDDGWDDNYGNEEYDDEEQVDHGDFDTEYNEHYQRAYSSDPDEDDLP